MEYLGYIFLVGLLFLGVLFIFNKKKVPVKYYILLAIIGGLLAAFASFMLETFFGDILVKFLFIGNFDVNDQGQMVFSSALVFYLYYFVQHFLMVAPLEEISKNLIAYVLNEKTEHKFLSYIECVMPYLIMGIAFSIVEDYLYIKNYDNGLMRLMIFLPGHPMFAMIFGHFYYKYRVKVEVYSIREILRRTTGEYKKFSLKENKFIKLGLLISCLIHGTHNFIAVTNGDLFYCMYLIELVIFVVVFVMMIKNRKRDAKKEAVEEFLKYYPEYNEERLEELGVI